MASPKKTTIDNPVLSELIKNLNYHFIISTDSTGLIYEQITYFSDILAGKYSDEPILSELLARGGALKMKSLLDEKGEYIKVGTYLSLCDLYLKDKKSFFSSKQISKKTGVIIEGILLYSLYLIDFLRNLTEETPKNQLLNSNKKLSKLYIDWEQFKHSSIPQLKNSIDKIKNLVYSNLLKEFNDILNSIRDIKSQRTFITTQIKLVNLSLEEGDITALRKFHVLRWDNFNLHSLGAELKKYNIEYSKYGEIDYAQFLSKDFRANYCGFFFAFIEYLEHLKNLMDNGQYKFIDIGFPLNQPSTNYTVIKSATHSETTSKFRSFKLKKGTPSVVKSLTDLMNSLKNHDFIDKGTSIMEFREIFNGTEIKKPIKWIGSQPQLHYFINKLIPAMEDCNQWVTCSNCFLDKKGVKFASKKLRRFKEKDLTKRKYLDACCENFMFEFKS
ncbi:MAG: hypothetical protein ACLQQ4_14630 [Bacteroidia bacterium]